VPVTPPVGAGLTPSDVNSVEPSGIPVVPTDPLAPIPSGEVAPSEGTAVSGSSGSSTWANAGPAHNRHQAVATSSNGLTKVFFEESGSTAAIAEKLGGVLRSRSALPRRAPMPISFAAISLGARLSSIDQFLRGRACSLGQMSSGGCSISCRAPRSTSVVRAELRKPPLLRKRSSVLLRMGPVTRNWPAYASGSIKYAFTN
jgi:hypothetical protein